MGFDRDTATAHGFRAMARTMAAERLAQLRQELNALVGSLHRSHPSGLTVRNVSMTLRHLGALI